MSLINCLVLRAAELALRYGPAVLKLAFCLPLILRWFYNPPMSRISLFIPAVVAVCLAAILPATAQTPPAESRSRAEIAPSTSAPTESRTKRIRIEDASMRIDELRVGGETRAITVAPKSGMPAYDMMPVTANLSPGTTERTGAGANGGARTWKILGF